MNIADFTATIAIKFRPGMITRNGCRLCRDLAPQIWDRKILYHPFILMQFLWLFMKILGLQVKTKVK